MATNKLSMARYKKPKGFTIYVNHCSELDCKECYISLRPHKPSMCQRCSKGYEAMKAPKGRVPTIKLQ